MSAAQAAKAIGLAEDGTWTPATPSRRASILSASSDHLLDAPPDYAQATAQQSRVRSPPADEESLYSADDSSASFNLLSRTQKIGGVKLFLRQHWRRVCLLNLAVYCILTTTVLIVGFVSLRKAPFSPDTTSEKLDIFPPDHPYNHWNEPAAFHRSTPQCQFRNYGEDYRFFRWLDPTNFTFGEALQQSDYREYHPSKEVSITGNIDVRPAPYGQDVPIEVIVSFATTSSKLPFPKLQFDSGTLQILPPSPPDPPRPQAKHGDLQRSIVDGGKECLDIWVGVYINTQLDDFNLHTEGMHVDIGHYYSHVREQWSFRIREASHIYARVGNVTTSNWDSRNANVTSGSGSIKGTYGLNDNLHLHTNSGDIDVTIWQQAAHEQRYLLTHPPNTPANLSTITGCGKQTLRILQALNPIYWAGILGLGYPFLLKSSHYSKSGSISIDSGSYWEGQIHAKSMNGSLNLRGEDLQILPDPTDGIPFDKKSKETWAKKGSLGGEMTIETLEGDVRLCANDIWECGHDYLENLDYLSIQ